MNIAFNIAHPSHYYLFRKVIADLKCSGNNIFIFIKTKDIVEDLLKENNVEYINIYPESKPEKKNNLIKRVLIKNTRLYKCLISHNIDILVSGASDVAQASFLAGIPSIIFNDDDASVVPLSAIFGWPFASVLLVPESCRMGMLKLKSIHYHAYQKTAYLHPEIFNPDPEILEKYNLVSKRYFLIRTVSLTAHHDNKIRGLDNYTIEKIVNKLKFRGEVIISSERNLPENLSQYQKKLDYSDIHHLIKYCALLIADSQSMTHEAALLGTPSIRYNDFVGRMGVFNELEEEHKITIGIKPENPAELIKKIDDTLQNGDYVHYLNRKIKEINAEVINLASFASWFIENYPESKKKMKKNPDYQYRFK